MFDDDDTSEQPRHRRLRGDVVLGPEWRNFAMTLLLGAVPVSLFFVFIAPDVQSTLGWAPIIVVIVVSAVMYISLLMTGLKDPGIIGREPPAPDEATIPRLREYDINGFGVTTKRCTTCHVYRPPRCSHCAVCNNCVEKFDHHCPWVGTCIGRRNYQPYLAFIYSAFLDCLLVIGLCIYRLVDQTSREEKHHSGASAFQGALQNEPVAPILIIYCFLLLLFVGALSALHTYLLSTNQTTYEYFRHRYARADNPFRRTFAKNCYEAFCGATGLYKYYANGDHPALAPVPAPTPPAAAAYEQQEHSLTDVRLRLPTDAASWDAARQDAMWTGDFNGGAAAGENGAQQRRDWGADAAPPRAGNYAVASPARGADAPPRPPATPAAAAAAWGREHSPSRALRGGGPLGDAPAAPGGDSAELELAMTSSSYLGANGSALGANGGSDALYGDAGGHPRAAYAAAAHGYDPYRAHADAVLAAQSRGAREQVGAQDPGYPAQYAYLRHEAQR